MKQVSSKKKPTSILQNEREKAVKNAKSLLNTVHYRDDSYDYMFEDELPAPVRMICRMCVINLKHNTNHTDCLLKGFQKGLYKSPSDWEEDCKEFSKIFAPDESYD
jgi:hypothetical protein